MCPQCVRVVLNNQLVRVFCCINLCQKSCHNRVRKSAFCARPARTLDSHDSKKGVSFEFETEKNKGTHPPFSRTNFFIWAYKWFDLEIESHLNRFKNFKNFQRNQLLYMQRLNENYGVGFKEYEYIKK